MGNLEQYLNGHVTAQIRNMGANSKDKTVRKASMKMALTGLQMIAKDSLTKSVPPE